MDYYSILGVNKNASENDIRKAYKKKSMQYHPDRPGGNEEEFKKVNEAYSILKDPQKRSEYDNPQVRVNASNFNGDFDSAFGGGFEDIFSQMFSQSARPRRTRNPDITIGARITFAESMQGKKVIATYRLRNGREESVNIDIPPGAKDGDTIRFHELGEEILPGPRGNLLVRIRVLPDRVWKRDGNDLYRVLNINVFDLITGGSIIVDTVDNKQIELKIPKGTKAGTKFSINDYGAPDVHTGRRGKLFLQVDALIPNISDESLLQKVRDLNNEISKIS